MLSVPCGYGDSVGAFKSLRVYGCDSYLQGAHYIVTGAETLGMDSWTLQVRFALTVRPEPDAFAGFADSATHRSGSRSWTDDWLLVSGLHGSQWSRAGQPPSRMGLCALGMAGISTAGEDLWWDIKSRLLPGCQLTPHSPLQVYPICLMESCYLLSSVTSLSL